jgi:hypothetical protein
VVVIGFREQVYGFSVVVVAMIVSMGMTLPMIVALPVVVSMSMPMSMPMPMPMPLIVAMARLTGPGGEAKLAHFAVHGHLAQVGFDFAIAQNLHQLRVTAHLR